MPATNSPPTFLQFLQLLEIATTLDRLQWENTPDENEFRASLAGGYVWFTRFKEVSPGLFSEDALPGRFTLRLLDHNHQLVDRLHALGTDEVIHALQFFGVVRRKVLNIENMYDTMISDLREKANQPQ